MSEDIFIDMMDQWLGAAPQAPRIHPDKIAKPEMLFHYEGGFHIGEKHVLRRTRPAMKKIAVYRGAHP